MYKETRDVRRIVEIGLRIREASKNIQHTYTHSKAYANVFELKKITQQTRFAQ